MSTSTTMSFEQLDQVRHDVVRLVPGYFIQELDPVHALEQGQGNCFTTVMIAAAAIANTYGLDASVAWGPKAHAIPQESDSGFALKKKRDLGKSTDLKIGHIELLVPRTGGDDYDILALSSGLNVKKGKVYQQEDTTGRIINYNFMSVPPQDADISRRPGHIEPVVRVGYAGQILTTEAGKDPDAPVVVHDWQRGGTEYLAELNLPEIDYDNLEAKVACFMAALHDKDMLAQA
jgi:hypothetical protein